MPKKISRDEKEAVKSGIRSGRTTMDISRTTGVSNWTINRIRKEEKNMKTHDRGGRPLVVSKITSAIICLKFRQGPLGTASDAQLFLRSLGYNISKRSVRRLLRKLGFKSGIKKHKPFCLGKGSFR
jgi:transposase